MTLSVITICFNNLGELKETCASVDMQTKLPTEHWIVDGSNNDEIKKWLESQTQPNYRKWICERDNGIADAFNKGIERCTGTITQLLNSGDTFFDKTVLAQVIDFFQQDDSLMWCHGKLHMLRGGLWVNIGKPFEKGKLYRGMRGTLHPTMFVKRILYQKYGLFDLNLKMAMDYDFLCRIANEKNGFIDYPLVRFDPHGISSEKYLDAMYESYAAYRKYYGNSLPQRVWAIRQTCLYYLLESKFGKWLFKLKVKMGMENT
ncbi:MAG: glycosyltransferase [Bacteroidetes bacterium]|nr:glycosyltransferase [Bacteroidota bacterium]MBS1738947.1 glycosyltransferase [Bacteroidota bacterium]MBS1775446.1 glycosyltransferase [Bacteroidota bacterium]